MKEILKKINDMSSKERRNIPYNELVSIVNGLTSDEIEELSNIIGYPVFTRMCMGELRHKFVLLQDGAAAIIVNDLGQILLQRRTDNDKWGLPGGCQELGERFEETIIREVKEETNLDVKEENLQLIAVVSGDIRKHSYPNGDIVYNNTVFYLIKNYDGELSLNEESKELKFFDIKDIPDEQFQLDPDLVKIYLDYINKIA